ncbi:hypothetical protein BH23ACT5_BH23ACT5_23760 [soil metagenome]
MGDHTFGSTVRKRRDVLGLSQTRLAELVGRSASTVRNWERGRGTPSAPHDVVALAAILGLDESFLLQQAGFEPTEVETSPTMQQALASLVDDAGLSYPGADEVSHETAPEPETSPMLGPDRAEVTDSIQPIAVIGTAYEHEGEVGAGDGPAATTEVGSDADGQAVEGEVPGKPTDPGPPGPQEAGQIAPARRPWAVEPVGHSDVQPQLEEGGEKGEKEPTVSIRELFDAGVPPSDDWSASDSAMPRAERRRRAGRAAPPTVLESAPVGEPSYLEDPAERQRYRVRAVVTAAIVVFLAILFLWAFDRTTDALGDMWQQFVDMLTV